MVGGYYLGFEGSSSNASRQCVLHLILPKPDTRELYNTDHTWDVWGTPEKVVTDGGPGFNSGDMFISCGEAGFVFEILPVQTAWWKPHIERFFRSLSEKLLKPLPGSTFSNIIERGGYDPAQYACISLTGLIELLHTFFVDVLPSQWHLGRECYPRKRWEEQALQYEPVLYHSADELRRIFSRTEARMIHDYGIEFETIRYNSLALQALADRVETGNPDKLEPGKKVRIKVSDYDLSSIDVIDETNPDAHVVLTVPSVNPRYTKDLSLWSHRIIRKFVNIDKAEGKEASLEDLIRAKEHLQEIVKREFLLTNSAKRRQKALRFLDETGAGQQPGGPKVTSSSVPKPKATAPATLSTPLALPSSSTSLPSPDAPAVELVQVSSLTELDPLPERPAGDYNLPGRNTGPRRGGIGGGTANNKR
jgi:putative transposase